MARKTKQTKAKQIRWLADRVFHFVKKGTVLGADRMEVKLLGCTLSSIGGLASMQEAYYLMQDKWAAADIPKGPDNSHPEEVQAAWDYIGEWRW